MIDTYWENLYMLLNFVDTNYIEKVIDKKEAEIYSGLIRATLSNYELLILFYYGLTPKGKEKFLKFIKNYTLFKNLHKPNLLDSGHEKLYPENAYK